VHHPLPAAAAGATEEAAACAVRQKRKTGHQISQGGISMCGGWGRRGRGLWGGELQQQKHQQHQQAEKEKRNWQSNRLDGTRCWSEAQSQAQYRKKLFLHVPLFTRLSSNERAVAVLFHTLLFCSVPTQVHAFMVCLWGNAQLSRLYISCTACYCGSLLLVLLA
jgi:hypothetical protein